MVRSIAVFFAIFLFVVGLTGCTTPSTVVRESPESSDLSMTGGEQGHYDRLVAALPAGSSVAVSVIHDRATGNVTALSEGWRERLEGELARAGLQVKARRDLAALVREAQTFRGDREEYDIWDRAGADVLVRGSYQIDDHDINHPLAEITIKAVSLDTAGVLATQTWQEELSYGWPRLQAQVRGNVHQRDVAVIAPEKPGPQLAVHLDRNPPCYPPEAAARLTITTVAGSFMYIFNIAADNSVTLLYPNRLQGNQPLASDQVMFPPLSLSSKIVLQLYPLKPGGTSEESFKVVVSRHKLDFSFLPVPENQIFSGARGGKLKQVLDVLRQAEQWSQRTVTYSVGRGCE